MEANSEIGKGKVVAVKKGYYAKQTLKIGRTYQFSTIKTALKGPHNMFNAICALRVGVLLGADLQGLQHGLDTFVTPPHRLEKVGTVAGVTYINDSKATNVDSVFYALQAMETKVVWIVGGTDKGNDYTPLVPWVKKKVRAIVCLGVDNTKLLTFFGNMQLPMVEAKSAQEAVTKATKLAKKGDTVLLSPACASFDLFNNYEHRGQLFREAVNQLSIIN
jgi:UDP-N-acetylmuramoylalanine--D-glutamate ligase